MLHTPIFPCWKSTGYPLWNFTHSAVTPVTIFFILRMICDHKTVVFNHQSFFCCFFLLVNIVCPVVSPPVFGSFAWLQITVIQDYCWLLLLLVALLLSSSSKLTLHMNQREMTTAQVHLCNMWPKIALYSFLCCTNTPRDVCCLRHLLFSLFAALFRFTAPW